MAKQKQFKFGGTNPLIILIGIVIVIGLLFWVAKKVLSLLAWAAPVFLLVALIVNYRVVLGYGRWLIDTLKSNLVFGLVATLFTIMGFPLVAIYLLLRALASKGIGSGKKESFSEYEEVDEDFLDISEIKEYEKRVQDGFEDLSS